MRPARIVILGQVLLAASAMICAADILVLKKPDGRVLIREVDPDEPSPTDGSLISRHRGFATPKAAAPQAAPTTAARSRAALTFEQAIDACAAKVRKANPYGGFDAYVRSSDNMVMSFGTPADRFAFDKCMDKSG